MLAHLGTRPAVTGRKQPPSGPRLVRRFLDIHHQLIAELFQAGSHRLDRVLVRCPQQRRGAKQGLAAEGSAGDAGDQLLDVHAAAGEDLGDVAHDAGAVVADNLQRQPRGGRRHCGAFIATLHDNPQPLAFQGLQVSQQRIRCLHPHDAGELPGQPRHAAFQPAAAMRRNGLCQGTHQARPIRADDSQDQGSHRSTVLLQPWVATHSDSVSDRPALPPRRFHSGAALPYGSLVAKPASACFYPAFAEEKSIMSEFVSGRHFLQTPGPTNLPDRVLHAMDRNAINHRGPDFGVLGREVVAKLRWVFQTTATIGIFPASGTGAWESALLNTLVPGDRILISRTGQFSHLWEQMALRLGLDVVTLETDWRRGADPLAIGQVLEQDQEHRIKAVCAVHSETSTSCMTDIPAVRQAMVRAKHPALLMVDAISSLGCADYRHDAWEVDVTIAGSQKGLMVPPGLAFTAISEKALAAARAGGSRRSYWDWEPLVTSNKTGYFPYTPVVNLLFALNEALTMMQEEGLPTV